GERLERCEVPDFEAVESIESCHEVASESYLRGTAWQTTIRVCPKCPPHDGRRSGVQAGRYPPSRLGRSTNGDTRPDLSRPAARFRRLRANDARRYLARRVEACDQPCPELRGRGRVQHSRRRRL